MTRGTLDRPASKLEAIEKQEPTLTTKINKEKIKIAKPKKSNILTANDFKQIAYSGK